MQCGVLVVVLGRFAATPAPTVAAAEPVAHDASATLDFDLGDFDVGANASASPAAEPAAETPIEEFDFGAVSTESGGLAGDEAATKLDLARAYLEMGDNEMARGLQIGRASGGERVGTNVEELVDAVSI